MENRTLTDSVAEQQEGKDKTPGLYNPGFYIKATKEVSIRTYNAGWR